MKNTYFYKTIIFQSLLVICLAIISCSKNNCIVIKHQDGNSIIDTTVDEFIEKNVPQNLYIFRDQVNNEEISNFANTQKQLDVEYNNIYFDPWKTRHIPKIVYNNIIENTCFGFGENLHAWQKKDFEFLQHNIRYQQVIVSKNAIITRNTMARRFPSAKPCFMNLKKPGESYPFDGNIQSLMKLGTPVCINSISYDSKWVYVTSHLFSGWVPSDDIAFTNKQFEQIFTSSKLCVAIKDNLTLKSKDIFVAEANIGVILPLRNKNTIMVPYRNKKGNAEIIYSKMIDGFVEKPYSFTVDNIIQIGQEMLGKNYGWGGFLNNRDCSMLTSDFFAVFGKHIERNSWFQINNGQNIEKLSSSEKKKFIIENAIQFLTLVGWKGHVMLYVGVYNNQPIFLHNIWSIPMVFDKNSRYIIGKTILSSVDFGNRFMLAEKIMYLQNIVQKHVLH